MGSTQLALNDGVLTAAEPAVAIKIENREMVEQAGNGSRVFARKIAIAIPIKLVEGRCLPGHRRASNGQ